jgi:hypothetical protein
LVLPLGEWLLFSLSFLALIEWRMFHFDKRLRILPVLWILGWLLENSILSPQTWHWHTSRIFVLIGFVLIAWKNTPERRAMPLLLTALTFLGEDLFLVNEPGIFPYDQWIFALILMCIAFLSAQSVWGVAFALSAGMLLNVGFSVFLFDGIVRHLDFPDPFLWHFSIAVFVGIGAFKQAFSYYRTKFRKPIPTEPLLVSLEPGTEDITALEENEQLTI